MSVDNKPDPPLSNMTWAESGINPVPGSAEPTEPQTVLKDTGYGLQLPLPHTQFNWIVRSIMRWIRWLVSKVDYHVHDGLNNPESVSKIKVNQHLDWGTGGELQVTSTGATLHELTHQGTAGTKRIITGQLRTATIQSQNSGTEAAVNVRDSLGNNGFLNSPTIQTDTIRANSSAGVVNIRSSSNSNAFLNVNVVQADDHLITSTIRSSDQILNVRDQTGTGPTIINTNVVQTDDHLRAPTVRSTGSTVNVQNNAGDPGTLNANVVQADDHLKAPTVRSTGTVLNVRSSNLSNAILDVNAVQTPTIKSTGSTVNVQNNAGDPGTLNANVVQVDDHLRSDQIRNKTVGGIINVRDSNGNNTTLDVNTVRTSIIKFTGPISSFLQIQAADTTELANVEAKQINAADRLFTRIIVSPLPLIPVSILNSAGQPGQLDAESIKVSTIKSTASGANATVNVRDSNGDNNITLNVNQTAQERSTILIAGQTLGLRLTANESDGLKINDSFTGNNLVPLRCSSVNAANVPKYTARINANGTVDYSSLAVSGNVTIEKTAFVSTTGIGEYTFTFPFTNRLAIITLIDARGFVSYNRVSDSTIRVLTTNTSNSYTNQNFSIIVF